MTLTEEKRAMGPVRGDSGVGAVGSIAGATDGPDDVGPDILFRLLNLFHQRQTFHREPIT